MKNNLIFRNLSAMVLILAVGMFTFLAPTSSSETIGAEDYSIEVSEGLNNNAFTANVDIKHTTFLILAVLYVTEYICCGRNQMSHTGMSASEEREYELSTLP